MNRFSRLDSGSVIFLALFLLVSLLSLQFAEAKGNAPIMVASRAATILLGANAVMV